MTVFHNLCRDYHEITAPPLDCARSGYLHTICSIVTKEKISSLRLRLLSQQYFHTDRIDRAAVSPTILVAPSPASHTNSTNVCKFSRLQIAPIPSASAGLLLLQITPVPSRFHATIRILNILHGVRARFICRLHAAFSSVSFC